MVINKFLKYTWKNEWIHPYESLYSIFEKFKAVNVFTSSEMSKILNMPPSVYTAKLHFNKEFNIFRNVAFSISTTSDMDEDKIFKIFSNIQKIIDKRIKYCPSCMKQGYHSVLHQLNFLNNCPIHNDKLIYLCDCENSYLITYKTNLSAYHCICGTPLATPKIEDCIMKLWEKPLLFPKISHDNIRKIKIIDYYNYYNRNFESGTVELNKTLKTVLADYFFHGFSNVKPVIKIKNEVHASSEIFFTHLIHEYIITKYGYNECLRNYWLPQSYQSVKITDETKENYNIDLISYFYLLEELLVKERMDQIYPISMEYGIIDKIDYSSYHDFLKFELNDICYEIRNFIYKRLIMERYHQIREYILNKNILPDTRFLIEIKNTFPIFIIIFDRAGYVYVYEQ